MTELKVSISEIEAAVHKINKDKTQEEVANDLVAALTAMKSSSKMANQEMFSIGTLLEIPIETLYKECYEGTLEESFAKLFICIVESANVLKFSLDMAVCALLNLKIVQYEKAKKKESRGS